MKRHFLKLSEVKLSHLQFFLVVARAGSISTAAAEFGLTYPGISRRISDLEKLLEVQLLERTARGVVLTTQGEILKEYALKVIENVHDMERTLDSLVDTKTRSLNCVYPQSHVDLAVAAFERLWLTEPSLRIHAAEAATVEEVEARLSSNEFDVGLGYTPTKMRHIEADELATTQLGLVVARDHPLAAGGRVTLSRLRKERLALLLPPARVRQTVNAYLREHRVTWHAALEADRVTTVLSAVRSGLAVTLLPQQRFGRDGLSFRQISPAPPMLTTAVLWPAGGKRKPTAEAFARAVKALTVDTGDR